MYKVEAINTGGFTFNVTADGYVCKVDAKAGGMTPPGMLLGGLASCIGVYIRKYADGAKLELEGFEVKAEAEFAKDAPTRFDKINISINLRGSLPDERRRRALADFIKNCPVHNTMEHKPDIIINVS